MMGFAVALPILHLLILQSGTGFATPSLTFKVSNIIEATKRFGRGCKPRPASGWENGFIVCPPYVDNADGQ